MVLQNHHIYRNHNRIHKYSTALAKRSILRMLLSSGDADEDLFQGRLADCVLSDVQLLLCTVDRAEQCCQRHALLAYQITQSTSVLLLQTSALSAHHERAGNRRSRPGNWK